MLLSAAAFRDRWRGCPDARRDREPRPTAPFGAGGFGGRDGGEAALCPEHVGGDRFRPQIPALWAGICGPYALLPRQARPGPQGRQDVTSGLQVDPHLITAEGLTELSHFAVGVPEPASASLLLAGLPALLPRRRRVPRLRRPAAVH